MQEYPKSILCTRKPAIPILKKNHKALKSQEVDSKLTKIFGVYPNLNTLTSNNSVTLSLVPESNGIKGNDAADEKGGEENLATGS